MLGPRAFVTTFFVDRRCKSTATGGDLLNCFVTIVNLLVVAVATFGFIRRTEVIYIYMRVIVLFNALNKRQHRHTSVVMMALVFIMVLSYFINCLSIDAVCC